MRSPKNQKWFYKALKEGGNQISISPRGQRAQDFFRGINKVDKNGKLPNSIEYINKIDFYVNSKIYDGKYNLYNIVY